MSVAGERVAGFRSAYSESYKTFQGFPQLTRVEGWGIIGSFIAALPCSRDLYGLEGTMQKFLQRIWSEDEGQDIAEYAVMLAVILVLVVGTIRLIGSNANNAFSNVASSINQ
jgi:Flp pilus assembly pilin Flp